jgi:hypothetical protein
VLQDVQVVALDEQIKQFGLQVRQVVGVFKEV